MGFLHAGPLLQALISLVSTCHPLQLLIHVVYILTGTLGVLCVLLLQARRIWGRGSCSWRLGCSFCSCSWGSCSWRWQSKLRARRGGSTGQQLLELLLCLLSLVALLWSEDVEPGEIGSLRGTSRVRSATHGSLHHLKALCQHGTHHHHRIRVLQAPRARGCHTAGLQGQVPATELAGTLPEGLHVVHVQALLQRQRLGRVLVVGHLQVLRQEVHTLRILGELHRCVLGELLPLALQLSLPGIQDVVEVLRGGTVQAARDSSKHDGTVGRLSRQDQSDFQAAACHLIKLFILGASCIPEDFSVRPRQVSSEVRALLAWPLRRRPGDGRRHHLRNHDSELLLEIVGPRPLGKGRTDLRGLQWPEFTSAL